MNIERYREIGLDTEIEDPNFSDTPHGKLAAKLIERIDKEAQRKIRPRIRTVGESEDDKPVNYRERVTTLVGLAHNRLDDIHNTFFEPNTPVIFTSQEQYDQFAEKKLCELSEDQAQTALLVLDGEDKGEELFERLNELTKEKMKKAEREGNLAEYLLWATEYPGQYNLKHDIMVTEAIRHTVFGKPVTPLEDYSEEIESRQKQFIAEARLVRRMHDMLEKLPDTERIKVAILRLPAEVDPSRPPRVLTYFPPHTFARYSDSPQETNQQGSIKYCITYASCLHHSFDSLYRLTREQKTDGQFAARAFYVTSQTAHGADDIQDFPKSARRFLEVSFVDETPTIPAIREEMKKKYPQVTFTQNPAILRCDIDPNLVSDGSQGHFILGYDESGEKVTQDLLPYVMNPLLEGVSNAYNIQVDQFFNKLPRAKSPRYLLFKFT